MIFCFIPNEEQDDIIKTNNADFMTLYNGYFI